MGTTAGEPQPGDQARSILLSARILSLKERQNMVVLVDTCTVEQCLKVRKWA
jgi:hypothetical protein